MRESLQTYRQKLRCNAPRVDEIFPGCLEEALGAMSPAGVDAWLEGASLIAGLGRGQELPLIFLEEMPQVAALAGEAVIQPVAELARRLSRAGAAKAIAPLLARLPACARRLKEPALPGDYLGLVERVAGRVPAVLPAMLERVDYLLGQLSLGGLQNWVDYGLRAYRDQPHRPCSGSATAPCPWTTSGGCAYTLRADARKAVEELSLLGIASYCITLDPQADQYVADIFGRNNYTVIDRIERLPQLFLSLTK